MRLSFRALASLATGSLLVAAVRAQAPGPCDTSDDSDCDRVYDNSGCFLNHPPASRVLECIDPKNSTKATEIVRSTPCHAGHRRATLLLMDRPKFTAVRLLGMQRPAAGTVHEQFYVPFCERHHVVDRHSLEADIASDSSPIASGRQAYARSKRQRYLSCP